MSGAAKKQAPRLARPAARYWKGKAPKGVVEVDSDSDEDENAEEQQLEEEGDVLIGGEGIEIGGESDEDNELPTHAPNVKPVKAMNIALKDVNISTDGRVVVSGRDESGKTEMEEDEGSSEEESDDQAGKGAESDEESGGEDSSSEDEAPKVQFRPLFVPKRGRATLAERDAMDPENEELQRKREEEAEERKKQSHDLVADAIRRELAEKQKEEEVPDIDDTDGVDPAGEFEAWRLRELSRIKKEKEEEVRREQEREEVERRRALPEAQRMQEDLEHAQASRDSKPKGEQKFMQKYWHKGAFYQDDEIMKKHNYTEATESTLDVSLLPKVMQVKDFGKRGRTKYTHLVDQDTTVGTGGFGGTGSVRQGGSSIEGGGCFLCGGPHMKKDCPQNTGPLTERGDAQRTGPNAAPTGPRKWGGDGPGSAGGSGANWRDRDERQDDRWKRQDRHGENRDDRPRRRHSRSRSRSPPRQRNDRYDGKRQDSYDSRRDHERRRPRSRNRSVESDHREKRRRLD
ncbi:splicing factor, Prp19-binding domain-containing protein [Flagelloscypha sp. PMI_526]|nr:splicing factor, Prp19-binding domain-containing protein [Flagelloscypha sp. PMI_526]